MDISLEKIDIIRDRTGVSYKEAKEALETSNGSVVDSLIAIEDNQTKSKWTESISVKGNEVMDKMKSIMQSGNVNRIRVKKDNTTILDIPVTAGALGAVVVPQVTAIGTAIALLTKCVIEVERPNKETINVNTAISNTAEDIANRLKAVAGGMKDATNAANQQNANAMNQQNANTGTTVGCTCGNLNIQTNPVQNATDNNTNMGSNCGIGTQSSTTTDYNANTGSSCDMGTQSSTTADYEDQC